MTTKPFDRILIPVASEADAEQTYAATVSLLQQQRSTVLVIHVIETGGTPRKTPVMYRKEDAERMLETIAREFERTGIPVQTQIWFGKNVTETILTAADAFDASLIVFTPRGASRLLKLLSGDITHSLVRRTTRPILILPASTTHDTEPSSCREVVG